jgi:molybdopterin-guanine dinucleotide biosynthesis protein A
MSLIAGIFVGGASSRMGTPKGLLAPPDGSAATLVERLGRVIRAAGIERIFLVGQQAGYENLGFDVLSDSLALSGPLGGIVALLERAREEGVQDALVLACDLPYVEAPLVRRLVEEEPTARALCPHVDDRYQPLFARYSVELLDEFRAALTERRLSLQPLLKGAPATLLLLEPEERASLWDWDTPADIDGAR